MQSAMGAALPGTGQGLALEPGQVDVWAAFVGEASEAGLAVQLDQVLCEEERLRHGRFRFAKDQRRYLVTRSLVRYVLSRYVPQLPPAAWRFEATAFGRPLLADAPPAARNLSFNLSHSDRVVLLGVTRDAEIGIDVEDLDRAPPLDVARSFFTPDELRQLLALPPDGQPRRFMELWTLKESYIKARGKGLSLPLDQFGFELGADRALRVQFDPRLDDSPQRWSFRQWCPSPDSVAALCVQTRPHLEMRLCARRVVPFASEEDVEFEMVRASSA